ncbi:hypothetical protein Tco_0447238, partial [Tanacetum coccineum]
LQRSIPKGLTVSASKKNSSPGGKLKNVKTEDDIPLSGGNERTE